MVPVELADVWLGVGLGLLIHVFDQTSNPPAMKHAGLTDELTPAAFATPKPRPSRPFLKPLTTHERVAVGAGSIMSDMGGVHHS